jgi:serine/threonine protein kinase
MSPNEKIPTNPPPLSSEARDLLVRFRRRWQSGRRLDIAEATADAPEAEQARILEELVQMELGLRLKAGEGARADDYVRRFPALEANAEAVVQLISAEFRLRAKRESVDPREFRRRFPNHTALIDELVREAAQSQFATAPPEEEDGSLESTNIPTCKVTDVQEQVGFGGDDPKQVDLGFLQPTRTGDDIGRLGSYRLLSVLGTGGMGMVFQAEDIHLRRPVAVKVMKPDLAKDSSARQRFLREARACAGLHSDYVVTIHQVGEDCNVPYFAMEFLEGMSLERWLKTDRKLSIPQVVRLGYQIAQGLAAVHAAGLVHRDIKPANIWLDKTSGRAKILDFGLARNLTEHINLTLTGTLVGTPAYMSPQQAKGETIDHRSDLFSLGSLLYRLLAGRLPFRGDTMMEVLCAVAMETPRPIREQNPAVPAELETLVVQLMEKDPDKRPQSADEVFKRLRAMTPSGAAIPAVPKTPTSLPSVPTNVSSGPGSSPGRGDPVAPPTTLTTLLLRRPLLWIVAGLAALTAVLLVFDIIMRIRKL